MSRDAARDELIRKIRVMLNANGRTEAEALANAKKAHEWLARHNIDLAEVAEDAEGTFVDITEVPGKYNETWRKNCYQIAAQLFLCNYFFRSHRGRDCAIKHCVVGEAHNVLVAVEMGGYFEATINRLANEATREVHDIVATHTSRHRFIRTFRLAATMRLRERVQEYLGEVREGIVASDGSNLPALAPLYDRSQRLYEAWLEHHGLVSTKKTGRDKLLSRAGRRLGREAGDQITFVRQLEAGG